MALVLAGAACILAVLLGWAVALANDRAGTKVWSPWCARWCFLRCIMRVFCGVQEMLDDLLADCRTVGVRRLPVQPGRCGCWAARRQGSSRRWSASCWAQCCALRPFASCWKSPNLRRMTARKGTARTAYHARKTRPVSLRQALLRRELLHLGSSSAYMLNSAMGTLGLLVLAACPCGRQTSLPGLRRPCRKGSRCWCAVPCVRCRQPTS